MIDFYTINLDYLSKLYEEDSEVYYYPKNNNYGEKPYVGIVVTCDAYKYFIPLTSGKEKHKRLKNTCIDYLLVYEYVQKENLGKKDI